MVLKNQVGIFLLMTGVFALTKAWDTRILARSCHVPTGWLKETSHSSQAGPTLKVPEPKHKAQGPKRRRNFPQQRSGTFRLLRRSKSARMELPQSPGVLRCAGEMDQDFRKLLCSGQCVGLEMLLQRHFILTLQFLSDILIHTPATEKWDLNSSLDHLAWASTWIRSAVIVLYSSLISKSLKPESLKWVFPFWNRK